MNPFRIQPLAYTVKQSGDLSNLSRAKLYSEMAAGRLAFKCVGKRRLVNAASLHKLIGAE